MGQERSDVKTQGQRKYTNGTFEPFDILFLLSPGKLAVNKTVTKNYYPRNEPC